MKRATKAPPDDAARLRAHGLNVARIDGDTVHWSRPPTEAEQAFASELLARKVSHV